MHRVRALRLRALPLNRLPAPPQLRDPPKHREPARPVGSPFERLPVDVPDHGARVLVSTHPLVLTVRGVFWEAF
jgi:hypothetical protein